MDPATATRISTIDEARVIAGLVLEEPAVGADVFKEGFHMKSQGNNPTRQNRVEDAR
jgi:hypothetical protein